MKHILWLLLSPAFLAPTAPSQAQDLRAKLEALQKKIALLGGEEVKNETDPGALAASLGHDVGKIFAFARSLPLHPYAGALRGPAGTLLAGAANNVDRCLLLKEMLQVAPAKPAVRFAFADLTEAQAAALAARALRSVPGMPGHQRVKVDELLRRIGETEANLAAARTRTFKAGGEHLQRFSSGFAADRAAIDEALKGAGAVPSGTPADSVVAAAKTLRSHVWLQLDRNGEWVDLDPSFPEATVGWAPGKATRTSDSLPEDLVHRIAVRLFVERRNGDQLETEPIFAGARRLTELPGRAICVTLLPMGFNPEKSPGNLERQASGFTKFQAVVDLGGLKENSRVFDVKGRIFQSKDGKFGADFSDAAGERVLGAFGRKPTALAAVRIEVEIAAPGRKPHVERRYLLDRVKAGTRAGGGVEWDPAWQDDVRFRLGLFRSWSIFPATATLNESFRFERMARMLVHNGGLPKVLFETVDSKAAPKLGQVAEFMDPLPMGLVEVWQSALQLAQGAFAPGEGACFPEGGSILVWKEELAPGEKKGEIRWRAGVDVLHAPLGCVAKAPASAARARLLFGLLLSEGESALMEGRSAPVLSAAAVFRKARESKIPVLVLKGKLEGLTLAPRAQALVQEELKAGRLVLIPREPVTLGGRPTTAWWRIDPVTGACLGVGDTGEGQGTSEGVLILENISIPMVQRCMKFVVCLNLGIGAGRSMQDAGRECMTEFMRDFIKDTVEGAIDEFVVSPLKEKADAAVMGGIGMQDPELAKMIEQARETWGVANEGIDELTFSGLRAKVAILLDMGNEIAAYAHKKNEEFRNR